MWELKKGKDGQIFGPVDMDTLMRWSANGQISPMDTVIDLDNKKHYAPYEISELEMIWEVTLQDGAVYGPTHANAVRVFVREGQILPKDTVRDILRGEKFLAGEFELYLEKQYPLQKAEPPPEPQTIAASEGDRKSETRFRPVDESRKKEYSKTRLKPIEDDDIDHLDSEELKQRVLQLLDALKTEQANYEKLKQHYQDLNQRFVELKDRVKAMGGGVGE
jgi:hypothetical protein